MHPNKPPANAQSAQSALAARNASSIASVDDAFQQVAQAKRDYESFVQDAGASNAASELNSSRTQVVPAIALPRPLAPLPLVSQTGPNHV